MGEFNNSNVMVLNFERNCMHILRCIVLLAANDTKIVLEIFWKPFAETLYMLLESLHEEEENKKELS